MEFLVRVKEKWRREEHRDFFIEHDYTRKFNKATPRKINMKPKNTPN